MKKFNPENKKINLNKGHLIMAFSALLVITVIGISFASYTTESEDYVFINSKVGEFSNSDIQIAVLVDGVKQDTFPAKGSGYAFESVTCENGSTGTWDNTNWGINIFSTEPDECVVNFITQTGITLTFSQVSSYLDGEEDGSFNTRCTPQYSTDGGNTWTNISFGATEGSTVTLPEGAVIKTTYVDENPFFGGCAINICTSSDCTADNDSNFTYTCPNNPIYSSQNNSVQQTYAIQSTDTHYSLIWCHCLTGNTEVYVLERKDKKNKKKKRKKLKDIQKGDYVYVYNETTGKEEPKKVIDIRKGIVNKIYKITLASGEIIESSESHGFIEEVLGLTLAKELRIGHKIIGLDNQLNEIVNIEENHYKEGIEVYNLKFEGDKTRYYIVAGSMILTLGIIASTQMNQEEMHSPVEKNLMIAAVASS